MPQGGRQPGAGRPKGSRSRTTRIRRRLEIALLHADALTAVRVLEELRRVAFANLGDCFDKKGHLRAIHTLSREVQATLASVKTTKKNLTSGDGLQEDVVEIKLLDKVRALEHLARHFALLTDVVQVDSLDAIRERLKQGRELNAKWPRRDARPGG